ncbi:MAG: DUF4292 domain-containing protein [Bacteroidales bacterium]|nr:DUF4292 domain-containing protein [Bacteroidales bacterium]OPZ98052.1 MAG: hypothetical protein BWY72_00997 [Bacteroidetes bacterium ADurb.Bin416]
MKNTSFHRSLSLLGTVALLLVVLTTGCRTSKQVVTKPSRQDMDVLKGLLIEKPAVKQLNSKVDFWFSSREGISTSMKGAIKLSTDSCMILSLQPFAGIEIARCLIRPDSLVVVSRMHQIYATESLSTLPFSAYDLYNVLEDVLTNRIFIPGNTKPSDKDLKRFTWAKSKESTSLILSQRDYALTYVLNDDQQYHRMSLATGDSTQFVYVNYDDFKSTKDLEFPNRLDMQVLGGGKTLRLKVGYQKPTFNSATDMSFPIPDKYRKVTLQELIKRFQDML